MLGAPRLSKLKIDDGFAVINAQRCVCKLCLNQDACNVKKPTQSTFTMSNVRELFGFTEIRTFVTLMWLLPLCRFRMSLPCA